MDLTRTETSRKRRNSSKKCSMKSTNREPYVVRPALYRYMMVMGVIVTVHGAVPPTQYGRWNPNRRTLSL